MYKQQFKKISNLRDRLNHMEEELKSLGHGVGAEVGVHVNQALSKISVARDGLWEVDKALEAERNKVCSI
jgi:hypothetical protein